MNKYYTHIGRIIDKVAREKGKLCIFSDNASLNYILSKIKKHSYWINHMTDVYVLQRTTLTSVVLHLYNIPISQYIKYIYKDDKKLSHFEKILRDMKFDFILMNPPYDGGLHMKFLAKAEKYAKKVVSIQPISGIRENKAFGDNLKDDIKITDVPCIFPVDIACQMFPGANIRQDLGIIVYEYGNEVRLKDISLYDNKEMVDKCLSFVKNSNDNLNNHLEADYTSGLTLKFTNGAALYGHGKISKSTFRLSAIDYNTAISTKKIGHIKRLNKIPNETIQKNIWEFYNSVYMRHWYHMCLFSEQRYDFVPFLGYKKFNKQWEEKDYKNFFIKKIGFTSDEWKLYKEEAEKLPV